MFLKHPLLKTLFLIANYFLGLNSECTFSNEIFLCRNIDIIDFYKEYFKDEWENRSISEINFINCNIPTIDYNLYKLPRVNNAKSFQFKNCQLSDIDVDTFFDFKLLKVLDLSFNYLDRVSFIDHLSGTLEKLFLSNNKITYVDTNFNEWKNLIVLDLSFNKINILDFQIIRSIPEINFSHNEIHSLEVNQKRFVGGRGGEVDFVKLNLSRNELDEYDEHQLFIIIEWLDLSYNHLKMVNMKYSKSYLSLAYCRIFSFLEKISVKFADLTAVDGIEKVLLISDHLVLKNNHFGDLGRFKIDIREFYDNSHLHFLDLSNSSITSIPEDYFIDIVGCSLLNLTFNNISLIKKHSFRNSNIDVLDLSYSNIRTLEISSFKDANLNILKLNNNKISILNAVFENARISQIDFSYNWINHLKIGTFEKLYRVKILNLSNCLVEKIDSESTKALISLELLDLSDNKIVVLESDVFNELPVAHLLLKGNKVSALKSHSFNNLYNIVELDLSHMSIETIAINAFYNLTKIKKIDLSHNKIQILHSDLFVETPILRQIDFSGNPLKSLNKFSNKLNIAELSLSFTGTFQPDRISNFNIKHLTIQNSRIDSLKNGSLKGLYSLTHLYFNQSHIKKLETGALIDLFNLEYLDTLNLFKNMKILEEGIFRDLNKLKILNLSNIGLNLIKSRSFLGLFKAEILLLNQNNIAEITNDAFVGLGNLGLLNLSSNRISKLESGCFFGLGYLKMLLLADNNLRNIEENVFVNLDRLEVLNLEKNNLTVLQNECLKGVPNLLELKLSQNNLKILETGVFRYLPELRFLNLRDNNLGASGSPQHLFKFGILSNLKKLEILDLTYNHFSTLNAKNVFMSLKRLKYIYLNHNDLKSFDFNALLNNSRDVEFIGISFNKWHCDYLSGIVELLYSKNVNYTPEVPVFNYDNIEGINCTDICKYVYCEGQDIAIVQFN